MKTSITSISRYSAKAARCLFFPPLPPLFLGFLSSFWTLESSVLIKRTSSERALQCFSLQSEANESKNTRRNYDYRVVMHTFAGADIDMRGRCSAGQKVRAIGEP